MIHLQHFSGIDTGIVSRLGALKSALLLVLVFSHTEAAYSQPSNHSYEIIRHGRNIGSLTASRETVNGATMYTLAGTSKVKLLIDLTIRTLLQETEVGGVLISYKNTQHVNDYDRMNKFGIFRTGVHEYREGNSLKRVHTGPVECTVASLYFREPTNQTAVFSEGEQQFVKLIPLGNHSYQLLFKDNGKTTYSYRNGKCVFVHAETMWSDVEFRIIPSETTEL